MVIRIRGETHWLWRAVDADGEVLDILVQSRRNAGAAERFRRKLIRRWGRPRVIVTDKLGSYFRAICDIAPGLEHRRHKGLNNRIEASHRHAQWREKALGRFKSPGQA
jgi:putative transposase